MVLVTMLIMPFKIAFFFWALYKAFTFKSWFKKFNEKAGGFASLSNADKAMFVVNVVVATARAMDMALRRIFSGD